MKKLYSVILIVAALCCVTSAKAEFRYGPTLGVDMTNLKFKQDLFAIDGSTGFQAGVQGELMIPGIGFGIDIAGLYTQRGATLHMGQKEVWASQGVESPRLYLHYFEVPLNLRFKWTRMSGLEDYVAPYVFGGPTFSFLVGHSKLDVMDFAGADLGLQCGIGFELLRNWQIQASYTWGMTYACKTVQLDNFSARNTTWSIRVAYLF